VSELDGDGDGFQDDADADAYDWVGVVGDTYLVLVLWLALDIAILGVAWAGLAHLCDGKLGARKEVLAHATGSS